MTQADSPNTQDIKKQFKVIAGFIVLFWALEIFDVLVNNRLDGLGIRPRDTSGFNGILFAPWLHFGFGHLAANTIPFAVLGWFSMLNGMRRFAAVTVIITLLGGLGTWVLGSPGTIHAGASILIFGYFGYLLVSAVFERSLKAMSLALIVIFLYGSMIWGIFPFFSMPGVSWQGHFSGFLAGVFASWLLSVRPSRNASTLEDDEPEEYLRIDV